MSELHSPMILGLGHQKYVGKDMLARMMIADLAKRGIPAYRVAFADPLKEAAHVIWGKRGLLPSYIYEMSGGKDEVIPGIGKSARTLWIELGNKVREIDPNAWIAAALCGAYPGVRIITDVRYANEVEAIRACGGRCVRILRPDLPEPTDVADTALSCDSRWDYSLLNDDTPENLLAAAIDHVYPLLGIASGT
jgi:hypothetical protein